MRRGRGSVSTLSRVSPLWSIEGDGRGRFPRGDWGALCPGGSVATRKPVARVSAQRRDPREGPCNDGGRVARVSCLPSAKSLFAVRSNPLADGRCKNLADDLALGPVLCNRHEAKILGK